MPLRIALHEQPQELLAAGIAEAVRHGLLTSGEVAVAVMGFGAERTGSLHVVQA